jgi:hypothetical protein
VSLDTPDTLDETASDAVEGHRAGTCALVNGLRFDRLREG